MNSIEIMQDALLSTGNDWENINDGSLEATVAKRGFERSVDLLISKHDWPFATTVESAVRVPDADNNTTRDHAFKLPARLHLLQVLYLDVVFTDYELLGDLIGCAYDGNITVRILKNDPEAVWHPMATEILTRMVEAHCLRGINEDFSEANRVESAVERMLVMDVPRVDQQHGKRQGYKSKVATARRRRRV